MSLGEKLKQARLSAGLSQRQLCGEEITRNMLSQIEHGTARPSMDTLRYLAERLGKPVSWFLDENASLSPNQAVMDAARDAFDRGSPEETLSALEGYREPDPLFEREFGLLTMLALLGSAENAIKDNRSLYALELLERARTACPRCAYLAPELERRRLLLLGNITKGNAAQICPLLPSLDGELLLRARGALESGNALRAETLLRAAEAQDTPQWNYLMGEARRLQERYDAAANFYRRAEKDFPEAISALEICYRELGDYKQAYFYACKQKQAD